MIGQPQAAVDLSGMWQDEAGTMYRISQHSHSVGFSARSPVSGVAAGGRGRSQGENWEVSFRTSCGATGTGSGMLSTNGNRITGSFTTRYGACAHTIVRFQ